MAITMIFALSLAFSDRYDFTKADKQSRWRVGFASPVTEGQITMTIMPVHTFLPLAFEHIHQVNMSHSGMNPNGGVNVFRFRASSTRTHRFNVSSPMQTMNIRVIDPTSTRTSPHRPLSIDMPLVANQYYLLVISPNTLAAAAMWNLNIMLI